MKLRGTNHIELSYANAKAVLAAYEAGSPATIHRTSGGETFSVSVVSDKDHYTESEWADRTSPYLPPECWAGIPGQSD